MASIRKTKTSWHIRFQKKGKPEVIKTYPLSVSRRKIRQEKAYFEKLISLGKYDPWEEEREVSLKPLIDLYIKKNRESGNWTQPTVRTNRDRLNKLEPLYDTHIDNIKQEEVQEIMNNLDVSPVTKKGHRSTWNAFFRWLRKEYDTDKILVDLPVPDKIDLRNQDKTKYLTWNEVDRICKAIHFYHRQTQLMYNYEEGKGAEFYCDLIWFMFYSLLRRNEITLLKGKHYKDGDLTVHGKGRKIDTITLPPPADKIIQQYVGRPEDPVFATNMNRPRIHMERGMELALGERRGLFHLLRHGGIVHYVSLGIPVQFVSKLARHESIQITLDTYADVIPSAMKDVFKNVDHPTKNAKTDTPKGIDKESDFETTPKSNKNNLSKT